MSPHISLPVFLERLACPACGSDLEDTAHSVSCGGCGARFPISDDIPLLALDSVDRDTRAQIAFYDEHTNEAHETIRPWDRPRFHAWLIEEKFRLAIEPVSRLLGEKTTALVVCGGAGLDAEFLSRFGADVATSDISVGASRRALERARRRGIKYLAIVADAERLPFRDRSMDLVFVHDGLHHLPNPEAGVLEMLRVARHAVAITEPTPSRATKIAIRAGIAEHVEEAGNPVRRLPLNDLRKLTDAAGFEILRATRYAMFYRDGTGIVTRTLSVRGVFPLAQALTRTAMHLSAPIGNKLVFVAARMDDSGG
jgi:SAM-dependent methyltransferase